MGILKNDSPFRVYCWGRKSAVSPVSPASPESPESPSSANQKPRRSWVRKSSRTLSRFRRKPSEPNVISFVESEKDFVYYTRPTLATSEGYHEFNKKNRRKSTTVAKSAS